jgi:CDP-4-dehydro-6-deoxyglucose reductase
MNFKVTLAPGNKSYECASGARLLDAGLGAGLNLPHSCRTGNCSSCRGRVVEGRVEHGAAHPAYLTDEMKADGFTFLCCAKPLTDVVIEVQELVLHLTRPRTMPCRIKRVRRPAPDVAILDLRLPLNENLLFAAGQYIEFLLPDGVTRSYSIANAPSAEGVIDLELHVRHCPGGLFTDRVFNSLKVGEIMNIRGPLGTFYLREETQAPMILLATGTGIAPVASILAYIARKGIQRQVSVYWGARTAVDLYDNEALRLLAEQAGARYVPVLSRPPTHWTGRTGHVQHAALHDHPDLRAFEVYACGSPAMVTAARQYLVAGGGLPDAAFISDAFITERERAQRDAGDLQVTEEGATA